MPDVEEEEITDEDSGDLGEDTETLFDENIPEEL